MYIIIVGAGSIGAKLIAIATAIKKHNIVVIEKDPEIARKLASEYDITVINGNATEKDTVVEAGVDRADALVVTTSDDSENLMVASIAKELEVPKIYAIVNDPDRASLFEGIHTTNDPSEIVAQRLYNDICRPSLEGYTSIHEDSAAYRITVNKGSQLIGKPLSECMDAGIVPEKSKIVAIQRGEERWIPREQDSEIRVGDMVTVFTLNGKDFRNGAMKRMEGKEATS